MQNSLMRPVPAWAPGFSKRGRWGKSHVSDARHGAPGFDGAGLMGGVCAEFVWILHCGRPLRGSAFVQNDSARADGANPMSQMRGALGNLRRWIFRSLLLQLMPIAVRRKLRDNGDVEVDLAGVEWILYWPGGWPGSAGSPGSDGKNCCGELRAIQPIEEEP